MKEKKGEKGRFAGRRFIRTSLIVVAGIIMAAALLAGPVLSPSMAAEAQTPQRPIKLALFGVISGPAGMAGEACRRATEMWVDDVNGRGGLLGRKVEFVQYDTGGKPEEAVRWAREFAADKDTDFLFAHGSSAESFAVGAVSREIKKVIFVTNETTEFTADPKVRSPYCFRSATNTLLINVAGAQYAAKKSKELGLARWYTINSDYAYGRDQVRVFVEFLKKFDPDVQIVGQAWPKLGEPDFTPHITAIMAAKPDAVFDGLWGGDAANFMKQGSMYGLLDKGKWFNDSLTDSPVVDSLKKGLGKFPAGLYATTRSVRTFPDTKENHDFYDTHVKRLWFPSDSLDLGSLHCLFVARRGGEEGKNHRDRGRRPRPERPDSQISHRSRAEWNGHHARQGWSVDLLGVGVGGYHFTGTLSDGYSPRVVGRDA